MPVIPMVLVNGADGIGTGWSTNIPNYDPREIIANLRCKIKGEETKEMHPRYFGFDGSIEADPKKKGSYLVSGKIERIDDETLLISELPIKEWTQDYKIFLEKMMTGAPAKNTKKQNKEAAVKADPEIKDCRENHTDTTVSFTITASKEQIDGFEKEKGGLDGKFKINSRLTTSNMNAFDEHNRIIKFDAASKILDYFYPVRVEYYGKRKQHMLKIMRRDQKMLENRARFIEEVCADDLIVSNRKRTEILADLRERKYDLFLKHDNKAQNIADEESEADDSDDSSNAELAKGYEYLLGMKIWSLTFEKAEKLRLELAEKSRAVSQLEATPPSALWETDLDAIEEALDDRDQYYAKAAAKELAAQGKSTQKRGKKKAAPKKKRPVKKASRQSDDNEDVVMETKKPPAKKRPVKKASFDEDSDDDVFVVKKKPVAKKKTTAKVPKKSNVKKAPVKKKVASVAAIELDDSSDSEPESMSMSLMARMRKKDGKSEAAEKSRKRASPRASDSDSEELDSFDTTNFEPAALTPARKKLKATKSKLNVKPLSLDSDSDDESFDSNTKATKPVGKARPGKKVARNKTVEQDYNDFSDEDEEEFDEDILDDSEDDFVPAAPVSRNHRGTKRATYTVDSDSDDDFEFDE
jgi:DNA gyrase/topoisomerase IV subunit A